MLPKLNYRVTPHRCWKVLFLILMAHDDDNKLEAHNAGLLCVCVCELIGGWVDFQNKQLFNESS